MKKIRAAVVGYGNIGHFTIEALEAAPDFEIAGVVRRQGDKDKPLELTPYEVVDDIEKLKDVDVAILCTPTRSCRPHRPSIPWTAPEYKPSRTTACWSIPTRRKDNARCISIAKSPA